MAFLIATYRGFVESTKLIKHRRKLHFTPDVRQARPFGSFEQADKFMAPMVDTLPEGLKYFSIIGVGPAVLSHPSEEFLYPAEPEPTLVL